MVGHMPRYVHLAAVAGGSWVLWASLGFHGPWQIVDAWPKYEDCTRTKAGYIDAKLKATNGHLADETDAEGAGVILGGKDAVIFRGSDGRLIVWRFACLPGTLDPRHE